MNSPVRVLDNQRGIATVWAVIFLIVGVIITLTQVLDMAGTRSLATTQQSDSTAALFVAESGLQRAAGVLNNAVATSSLDGTDCTGIKPSVGNSFNVGSGSNSGSFSYDSAVSSPTDTCIGSSCTGCSVTVTGAVNGASRKLKLNFKVVANNQGTNQCGTSPSLRLVNDDASYWGTAVFNLAWRRQMTSGQYAPGCTPGAGGNASTSICGSCNLKWNVESSSGNLSAGGMGVSVGIAPTSSYTVTQTIDTNRHYTQVGVLLIGKSTTVPPPIIGSYWNDSSANGTGTVNNTSGGNQNKGETNSGVATSSGTCADPPTTYTAGTEQSCTNWCYGGDTLVFGISGRSATYADQITPSVEFNTAGTTEQKIALTRIARFPNINGNPTSTGDIFGEIWYAYNPDYLYGAQTTGSIAINQAGATNFTATISSGSSTLQITSIAAGSGSLSIGDTITTVAGIPAGTKINAIVIGSGGVGTYTMSQNAAADSTTTVVSTTRHVLDVTALTSGRLLVGQTLSSNGGGTNVPAGTTIASFGSGNGLTSGTYYLTMTAPTTVALRTITTGATSTGTTISAPNAASLPVPGTIVAVRSGSGQFSSTSKVLVLSVNEGAKTFTVELPAAPGTAVEPTSALAGAQICGGTCAFFDNPSSPTATTEYKITRTGGVTQWSSGFTCISGVDSSKITPVQDVTAVTPSHWEEVVTP